MLEFCLVYDQVKYVKHLKHYMNYLLKSSLLDDYGQIQAERTLSYLKDLIVDSFMMTA